MLSTDRNDFGGQLAVLFGGYPQFLTPPRIEAYWRGLQKMPLSTFARCVDQALSESGQDKLPTVNAVWQISRSLRAAPKATSRDAEQSQYDGFHGFGQRCLLAFLRRQPTSVADGVLRNLIAVKNRTVEQHRRSGDHGDATEWADVMLAAFAKEVA